MCASPSSKAAGNFSTDSSVSPARCKSERGQAPTGVNLDLPVDSN